MELLTAVATRSLNQPRRPKSKNTAEKIDTIRVGVIATAANITASLTCSLDPAWPRRRSSQIRTSWRVTSAPSASRKAMFR